MVRDPIRHRAGRAAAILAVLAGCAAALAGLAGLVSTTESPIGDGPASIGLALVLLAVPVVLAVALIIRILAGRAGRDDDRFLP